MKHLYGRYAAMYHFTYMAIGALTPMIGQYLKQIGFSGTQIGSITATGTAVAIFASAFGASMQQEHKKIRDPDIFVRGCGTGQSGVERDPRVWAVFAGIWRHVLLSGTHHVAERCFHGRKRTGVWRVASLGRRRLCAGNIRNGTLC